MSASIFLPVFHPPRFICTLYLPGERFFADGGHRFVPTTSCFACTEVRRGHAQVATITTQTFFTIKGALHRLVYLTGSLLELMRC